VKKMLVIQPLIAIEEAACYVCWILKSYQAYKQ